MWVISFPYPHTYLCWKWVALILFQLASGEPQSSAQVQNEADPDNLRDILNNLKQEMMENVKSLREEYDGRIETLTQHNDVIRQENDDSRKYNDATKKEIDTIRHENDVISNDYAVIMKANDVITRENDQLKARVLTCEHQMYELKSHLSTSDEQMKEFMSDAQEANGRFRQMEVTLGEQRSTKGHQQVESPHNLTMSTHYKQGIYMYIEKQQNKFISQLFDCIQCILPQHYYSVKQIWPATMYNDMYIANVLGYKYNIEIILLFMTS